MGISIVRIGDRLSTFVGPHAEMEASLLEAISTTEDASARLQPSTTMHVLFPSDIKAELDTQPMLRRGAPKRSSQDARFVARLLELTM